jgi:hypothetical protein
MGRRPYEIRLMVSPMQKYLVIAGGALALVVGAILALKSLPHEEKKPESLRTPPGQTAADGLVQQEGEAPPAHGPQTYDYKPTEYSKTGVELRPMDIDILELIPHATEMKKEQLLDVFPDRAYRVQLSKNALDNWINFVMIDLDRDGKWDEKWQLKPGEVLRYTRSEESRGTGVSSDGTPYKLRPGRWLPF